MPTAELRRWTRRVVAGHYGIGLVNQHVAAAALVEERLRRSSVARDHNGAVWRVKSIAERVGHFLVLRGKRRHRDVAVSIDDAGRDFLRVDPVAGAIVLVETIGARVDVYLPGLEDMLCHGPDANGAVDRERRPPPHHPG